MLNLNNIHAQIRQKPIAILGYGSAGRGVRALANRMDLESTCFDEAEIENTRQQFTHGDALQHSIAVISPGFKPDHPWRAVAKTAGLPIVGELDFGALFLSRGAYGVTGSNGKTTAVEYLTHTLNQVGQTAVAVGNNGHSLCGWLANNLENEPTTRLIIEISSFQAPELQFLSLEGLIWTNFSENHLDYHRDLNEYFAAKWNLVERLTKPLFVVGQSVFESAIKMNCSLPDFVLVVPNTPAAADDMLPANTPFAAAPFDEDWRLCVAFGELIGIPRVLFHTSAGSFPLPPHRLSKIGEINGVGIYNDAKCTTFAATLAALKYFQAPVLWIGGGKSKGGNISGFVREMAPKVKSAYLIGATGGLMTSLLIREGISATNCETLENAVATALSDAQKGDNILFSPAFASYDQFENFIQRGNLFEKIISSISSTTAPKISTQETGKASSQLGG